MSQSALTGSSNIAGKAFASKDSEFLNHLASVEKFIK
jgi:hypothetical protein